MKVEPKVLYLVGPSAPRHINATTAPGANGGAETVTLDGSFLSVHGHTANTTSVAASTPASVANRLPANASSNGIYIPTGNAQASLGT